MRTTLTLDEDVVARIRSEMRRSGRSFKETVNELLRSAFASRKLAPPDKPFRVRARSLGLRAGLSYDDVEELLERVEGASRR